MANGWTSERRARQAKPIELKTPTDDCDEKEGIGEIYIVGKNGNVED